MRNVANISRALAVEEGIELQCLAREMLVAAQRLCRHLEGIEAQGEGDLVNLSDRRKAKTATARNSSGPRAA